MTGHCWRGGAFGFSGFIVALALFALAACGGDSGSGSGSSGNGGFNATASGASFSTLSGPARYTPPNSVAPGILMVDSKTGYVLLFSWGSFGEGFKDGTFTLADGSLIGGHPLQWDASLNTSSGSPSDTTGLVWLSIARAGTLTITSHDDNARTASGSFDLRMYNNSNSTTIGVTGSFRAAPGP